MTNRPAPLTARRLNRSTLGRQLLLRRHRLDVAAAVHRIVAIQAQEPASPYIALWNRVERFDPADLDAAFAAHDVVKATLMRMTLHVVDLDDYRDFQEAMRSILRADRVGDARFTVGGLTSDELAAVEGAVIAFADRPRTRPELEAMLAAHVGDPTRAWWGLRSFIPLVHARTGGPWSFGRPAFVAPPPRPATGADTAVRRDAMAHLIRRYLEGFGPATLADIAQFARVPRGRIREALEAAAPLVDLEGPGATLLDVPDAPPIPDEDLPAPPRLLPMWDSTLLAYDDRTRILPADLKPAVIRTNGDVLPTVLVDGQVAGIWRPIDGTIEVTAFRRIGADDWATLDDESGRLVRFLADRDPSAFGRHRRWWTRLPDPVEVRRLPG